MGLLVQIFFLQIIMAYRRMNLKALIWFLLENHLII